MQLFVAWIQVVVVVVVVVAAAAAAAAVGGSDGTLQRTERLICSCLWLGYKSSVAAGCSSGLA